MSYTPVTRASERNEKALSAFGLVDSPVKKAEHSNEQSAANNYVAEAGFGYENSSVKAHPILTKLSKMAGQIDQPLAASMNGLTGKRLQDAELQLQKALTAQKGLTAAPKLTAYNK